MQAEKVKKRAEVQKMRLNRRKKKLKTNTKEAVRR